MVSVKLVNDGMTVESDGSYNKTMEEFMKELFDLVNGDDYRFFILKHYRGIWLFALTSNNGGFEDVYALSPREYKEFMDKGKIKLQRFSRGDYEEFVNSLK